MEEQAFLSDWGGMELLPAGEDTLPGLCLLGGGVSTTLGETKKEKREKGKGKGKGGG